MAAAVVKRNEELKEASMGSEHALPAAKSKAWGDDLDAAQQ
jgi:hypothetical protein